MKLVVHDASILIDLALSETVDAWFAGGVETWTTDLIFPGEIDRPAQRDALHAYAKAGKLKVRKLSADDIEVLRLEKARRPGGLSIADHSAIMLVRELGKGAMLATGDRTLRTMADREKLPACGLLALFDIMIASQGGAPASLPVQVAVAKLRRLLKLPACRIPRDKCEERIALWEKKWK